jgi:hypothetical protein
MSEVSKINMQKMFILKSSIGDQTHHVDLHNTLYSVFTHTQTPFSDFLNEKFLVCIPEAVITFIW